MTTGVTLAGGCVVAAGPKIEKTTYFETINKLLVYSVSENQCFCPLPIHL